jgi:ComF family protein
VLPQIAKLKGAALNLLFPQKCLGCAREGELLCSACQISLPRLNPPICPRCGRPQPSGIVCPECISRRTDIDGIRAPFRFEGLIREAVHQFKYKNLRSLDQIFSGFLFDYLELNPLPAAVLVPVPLHPRRLKERGYNQSSLLTNLLGKSLGLPVDEDCLVRRKFVLAQTRTHTAGERRQNVREAFACPAANLSGQDVLLIDDVSTSGATLDACAGALKSAGAKSVWGLVLAREI